MVGKNNKYLKTTKEGTKVESYSIKKFKVGAASVVIGASIFLGAGAVAQASEEVSNDTTTDNTTNAGDKAEGAPKAEAKPTVENTKESVAAGVAGKLGAEAPKEEAKLDKSGLEKYINEVSANLEAGKYSGKTDESVAVLKAELESAKATLANAKTQDELKAAYNKLVMTVNSKLRNKPVEKKEIPTVDTTNGKETVGKKAGNTEKKSDSNSIENTGSNDSRNGKELDRDNAFRTEAVTNKKPVGNIPFSNAATKDIYVYKGEETNIELSVTDDSGKIKDIRIGEGSRGVDAPGAAGSKINNQYGLTFGNQRDENSGIVATQDNPAKVTITGTVSVPGNPTYTGKLVTRYLVAEDLDGAVFSEPLQNQENANPLPEGYFKLWVRQQTQKYDIQAQTNEAGKIAVADVNNLSQADFEKIKNNIKITYNTADDARLLDKNGKLVENASNYIDTVTKQGDQIVVTYKDGSTDSVALTSVLRNNPIPTVKVPYSNQAEKQVYVYTGENTDLTFTANDDTAVKDLYLRGPGDVNWNNTEAFGFTTGRIANEKVTNGVGTVSDDKRTATIKMTGVTTLTAPNRWTSYVAANDNDNFSSMPADRNFNALDIDPDAKSKPGYIQFIVKDQTSKYDIAAPTEKVAVADPDHVTEADLEKIKEKLKLEYSNKNDDANLADKKGTNVDDKDSKIQSVTKDDQGNLVVTYKDGSKDKRLLSEFVSLDKQPAINAVNKAAEDKIAEINKTPNATDEEKATAIAKVNADKAKAVAAINDATVTTKDAIDKAQNNGTTAIAGDNPVVAKKAAAKADVEATRQAKADAITADKNLSQTEKDAAIAKINKAAEDATKAIDAATKDAAVDTAKGTGITEIGKVNPIAKENAKGAISNALTAKNQEIDNRTDLSQAEKDAAKAEAKKLADAELTKVNAQPDNAETAEAAATAQKLVNDAEDKGVADVTSVYPIAKEEAKKAVADELAKKEKELDGRKDLTTEEKAAAKKEAQDLAKKATDAINGQPAIVYTPDKATAAQQAVDTAKTTGVAEVKAVNPEGIKAKAKKAIDEEAKAKKEAIDTRTDLSDKAKETLKNEIDEMATEAKKAIDDENVTATKDVKDIKEVAKTAIKGVGEANIPANKVAVKDPSALTADEKAKVLDAVKKVNPNAKSVTQDEDGNVTVTTQNGDKVIITPDQVVKKDDLITVPKAGNNVVKPADKTLVKNPASLTPEEKAAIAAKVKEVNPDAVVTVDDKGNTTVSTKDGKTEVIPGEDLTKTAEAAAKPNAGNDINTPSDKTVVANPDSLTPEEKKAIEDKVKAVNPGATVVVDDKGNATVTTADGKKTAVIPASALTKTAEEAAKPNAGNDINTPSDKTVVANPDSLTPEEKKAIEDKVKAVNPGATVVVDDKGNATVTTKEGKTAVIPASKLVIPMDKLTDLSAQSGINTPATRTLVANKDSLTPEEIAKIKAAVEEVNPGAIVVVDAKGNATVTTKDGVTATIAAEQLIKDEADVAAKNDGENINLDFEKQVVLDLNHLTDADKAGAKAKIMAANPDVAEVIFDDKGNATVILKNGKSYTVLAKYIFKQYVPSPNVSEGNSEVKVDKAKLELAIHQLEELVVKFGDQLTEDSSKEAKDLLAQAKEVFNNPNATQAEVDAMVKRIEDFIAKVSKGKDGQSSEDKVEKSHSEENSSNRENTKSSNSKQSSQKELPNTGTSTFGTILPAMAALLSGVGLFAKKKKEDE